VTIVQRSHFALVLFAALALLASSSYSQWVKTGFPDIWVSCLAAKEGNLFAGTWGQGMYRSTDNGTSWTQVNNGLPDFYARWVYALAVVPSSSGGGGTNLFAGMEYGGVYRSVDDGASWTAVNSGLGTQSINIVALGVAGTTILAGCATQPGQNGVYRSVDDGGTWTRCNTGLVSQADSSVEAFASLTGGSTTYFYAGTGGGVFISSTDGTSWSPINNGLPAEGISALAASPGSGGIAGITLFAGVGYSGIYRSTDNGSSWSVANDGLSGGGSPYIYTFAVSPAPGGTGSNIFSVEGVVFVSTNNGSRWWDTGWPYVTAGPAKCLAINGDNLFGGEYGSFGGIWKYSLAPDTGWVVQASGTSDTLYTVKAVDNNVVWTAGTGGGVFRTTNSGATWISVGGGTIGSDVVGAVEALDANTALVATYSTAAKIFKTTNGGTSWSPVFSQTGGFIGGIQMKTALEGYAVGSPVGGKWTVLKTTDGGTTWARLTTEPSQVATERGLLAVQLLGDTLWFGTTSSKVYRSTDLGATWTSASTSGSTVYGLHFNSSTVGLTGFDAGVSNRSTNGGASWDTASRAGTQTITCISGLGNEFWATTGSGIAYTSSNGQTWVNSSPGYWGIVPLWAVSISPVASPVNGWAVGESGIILHYQRLVTSVIADAQPLPAGYALEQSYPNPFNPTTTIQYALPNLSYVRLTVYNTLGQQVALLVQGVQEAGRHEVQFNGSRLASGMYIYRLQAGDPSTGSGPRAESRSFVQTRKLLLLR
jgi:photosystem II stability/assembly factor-like uncharacterized protein